MKVSLPVNTTRWLFLANFFEEMNRVAPLADHPLASVLLAECYERYLKRFTWKPKVLTLTLSEAMALHECVVAYNEITSERNPLLTILAIELTEKIDKCF